MASGADLDPLLVRLIRQPLTLDIVNLMAREPLSLRALRGRLRAERPSVEAALRLLAAHMVVKRCGRAGSWDQPIPSRVRYELTEPGHELARQLGRFDVLVAVYDQLLHGPPD
jgi:hypothetical protein